MVGASTCPFREPTNPADDSNGKGASNEEKLREKREGEILLWKGKDAGVSKRNCGKRMNCDFFLSYTKIK